MNKSCLALLSLSILAMPCADPRATGVVRIDRITLDEDNVVALLEETSRYHVDAMRALIDARYRDDYRAIRWETLETTMRDAPLARLEYRYMVDGVERVKVYHAMGGPPLGSVARSIFEGPTRPATPQTPETSFWPDESDDDGAIATKVYDLADEVAADTEDSALFVGFDETNVRARIRPADGSVLTAFADDERIRSFDAEFKAMRAIEHDLLTKTLPRGGSVRGFVSSSMCPSCTYAATRLADVYEMDVHLKHVSHLLPYTIRDELVNTGQARIRGTLIVDATSGRPLMANDLLLGVRESQIRQSLSPQAMGRTFKGVSWTPGSLHLGLPKASRLPSLPRVSEGSNSPRDSEREGTPPANSDIPGSSATDC